MMEYGNTSAASIPFYYRVCRIIESRWMEVKNSSDWIRWRFDTLSCYNLVKHVVTHFKKFLLF